MSSSFSSTSSTSASSSMLLSNVSLSNPFSIHAIPPLPSSPTSSTTSSSPSDSSSMANLNKKVFHLEKELETIKIRKICFGKVSVKELDLFLEKVARVKDELKNSVVY